MANQVVHFEVIGQDPAALRSFYAQAFDWEVGPPMAEAQGYAMARPHGEGGIAGGIGGGTEGYGGHVTFYVETPDLDATLEKIESLGGKTMMPPDKVPGGPTFARFTDPEGHVIGLLKTE